MARGTKVREIDFSHKDFCSLAGIGDRNFRNWFPIFLNMYDMERKKFKRKQEEGDDYLWALEWTELAMVLVKSFNQNPFFGEKSDSKSVQANITAQEIISYYEILLKETENELPDHLKDLVISLDSYLATRKMVDKVPKLVERIGELTSALLLEGSEQPGDVIDYISQQLDTWIYNLYRNQYNIRKAKECAKAGIDKELVKAEASVSSTEDKELVKYWQEGLKKSSFNPKSRNLDMEMAALLKDLMKLTEHLNPPGRDGSDDWEKRLKEHNPSLETDISKIGLEDKRLLYYMMFEKESWRPVAQIAMARSVLENYQEKQKQVLTMQEKVTSKLKNFEQLSQEEVRNSIRKSGKEERSRLKLQIQLCEERLQELDNEDEWEQTQIEELEHEEKLHREYLIFYNALTKERKKYDKASQLFVGQLLLPFFLEGRKITCKD